MADSVKYNYNLPPPSYQEANCVLKVKDAKVQLIGDSDDEKKSQTLTTLENKGTSRRDQTYTFNPTAPVEGVNKVKFSQSFILAELLVYYGKCAATLFLLNFSSITPQLSRSP